MLKTLQQNDHDTRYKDKNNPSTNITSFQHEKTKENNLAGTINYFLEKMREKLNKPFFIRVKSIITFSENFPTGEFEKYFINYDTIFDTANSEQVFNESCTSIIQQFPLFPKLEIEWLTISNNTVEINNIFVKCKIQLTGKSTLNAFHSIFIPQDLSKTESAIEVFANSKAIFKNCHFYNAERVAVIARNYSSIIFENCVFDDNTISCFIMDDSYAKFIDCKFKNDKNISIFVTKDSRCEIYDCLFKNISGKAIFVKDSSKVYITRTNFINCQKGAATIAEKSSLFLDGQILIQNSQNTAIRAVNNCLIKANDIQIENTAGNAFNIDKSNGYFINCLIKGTIHPTIAVIGHKSTPIFHNCKIIENKNTFCVICKNCCRPLFDNCLFSNCKTNCFSVSDFSQPHIQNCSFNDIEKYYINSFGGSFTTYENLISLENIDLSSKINATPSARCEEKHIDLNNNNNVDDDKNEDEKEQPEIIIKSWKSPTYVVPPDIKEMQDPEIIMNNQLKPLKKVNLSKIIDFFNDKEVSFICSNCHIEMEKDDDTEINFINPCGHFLCVKCKYINKCPICDSSVKEIKKVYVESECSICLDKKPNAISLPCGHFCMCYDCAMKCSDNSFNCPMCNEPLNSYKCVFTDTFCDDQK